MQLTKLIRNGAAVLLIASMPVSATVAAVRPNAAVPTAGSAAITAQGVENGAVAFPWLPVGIIALTVALGLFIAASSSDNESGSISRA